MGPGPITLAPLAAVLFLQVFLVSVLAAATSGLFAAAGSGTVQGPSQIVASLNCPLQQSDCAPFRLIRLAPISPAPGMEPPTNWQRIGVQRPIPQLEFVHGRQGRKPDSSRPWGAPPERLWLFFLSSAFGAQSRLGPVGPVGATGLATEKCGLIWNQSAPATPRE